MFIHVIFWGVGVLGLIAAAITVGALWVMEMDDDTFSDWLMKKNGSQADSSKIISQGMANLFGVGVCIAATFTLVVLLALFIQCGQWIYGWGN